ncbi:Hypothetical protein CINCED_3A012184 [Cinara cedri]|uniref:Uncharacterized protein n=1 Tax=Cinara cedri TaxID=506608 RepID=A0A5E4N470_9HEMI|nr:Hypothetical protein CINCED_3A012184 [Cinara cedri]
MVRINVYLFVFLCFSTIRYHLVFGDSEFYKAIQKSVNVIKSDNDFIKIVRINESEPCNIYYDYDSKIGSFKENTIQKINGLTEKKIIKPKSIGDEQKVVAFYNTICCKFAKWTIDKIYKVVKSSPILYQYQFQDLAVYRSVYTQLFKVSIRQFFSLDTNIERFISIIFNFFETVTHKWFNIDNTFVKTLMTLQIKMYYLSLSSQNDVDKHVNHESDFEILRSIVEEMNALQRFLSMNCMETTSNEKNTPFYGYWITATEKEFMDIDNIEEFLFNIAKSFSLLEMNPNNCFAPKILLHNIVLLTSNTDQVSNEIVTARIRDAGIDNVQIKTLSEQIIKNYEYDFEAMFRYQRYVLTAIIKLMYDRIIRYIENEKLSYKVVSILEEICSKLTVSEHNKNLPPELIDNFQFLCSILVPDKTDGSTTKLDHKKYLRSLDAIKVNKNSLTVIELKEWTEHPRYLEYFENFMVRMNRNLDDFKCFYRYYIYLRDERENSYFIPSFTRKKTKLEVAKFRIKRYESPTSDEVLCKFFSIMYSICYQAVLDIGEIIDISASDSKMQYTKAFDAIGRVGEYFLIIIIRPKHNPDLLKVAYDIVVIWNNLKNLPEKEKVSLDCVYRLGRILNVIMTVLNSYEIKHCSATASQFQLFLFNNINLVDLGKDMETNTIEDMVEKFVQPPTAASSLIDHLTEKKSNDFKKILNVEYLYKKFIIKDVSTIIELYGEYVQFRWNGKKKQINDIFTEAINFTLNPHDFYVLYDLYFKFYIGVVVIKIDEVIKEAKNNMVKMKQEFSDINKFLEYFKPQNFPDGQLRSLVSDVISLYSLTDNYTLNPKDSDYENLCNSMRKELSAKMTSVRIQFEKSNVFFIDPKDYLWGKMTRVIQETGNVVSLCNRVLTKLNSELSSNVKDFGKYFSKIMDPEDNAILELKDLK